MTSYFRAAAVPLALLVCIGGCKKQDEAPPESRQVELAPAASAQPQLGDTARAVTAPTADLNAAPAAPAKPARAAAPAAPAARTPAAAAPAPAPARAAAPARATTGVIAGGSSMSVAMGSRVCTNTHKVGDLVTATLSSDVAGTNGAAIPAGASVTLRVSESKRGENGKEGIRLAFEPVSVTFGGSSYAIDGTATMVNMETIRAQSTGDQAKKVAAGAVIGAIAGQLLGKKTKSTVVGAAVGAAAGGAVAVGSADWNACLGAGRPVTVTLAGPVTVKLAP